MKEKTLVVLAAGMGSRFGGLKQITPIGPSGEYIIDYSIYSAIKYGFNKVIFISKKENLNVFESTIGSRISKHIKVEYAFQELNDLPEGIVIPESRVKPLGTAHAIYAARNLINDNFAVITSDDFYGDNAFKVLSEHLDNSNNTCVVGYKIGDTLSTNGSVKRGIIISNNNVVEAVIESSCIKEENQVICTPLNKSIDSFKVSLDQPVSMLMNVFNKDILNLIEKTIKEELTNPNNNLLDYEVLLPDVMDKSIKLGNQIDLVTTDSKWMGMTYKTDEELVKNYINKQIEDGVYPYSLW